ncbi:hypothetical protein CDD81_7967 [Ophiocordyceps australis]|uniref:Transcription factor domain-containing protein n=1 Tax=Ophiocordyceps australis TaxID=1399860 RepID=A0A2C5Y2D8_9HYPO|nr:hypothetical protein CDD81_7967 [Ophiocordyceps australis]
MTERDSVGPDTLGKLDGSDGQSDTPQYVFVSEQDQRSTRSHAMREHWKQRRRGLENRRQKRRSPTVRRLMPSGTSSGSSTPRATPASDRMRYINEEQELRLGTPPTALDGIPLQLLSGMNHALSCSRLDPFDMFPVKLTPEHHKLLHHWLITYSTMMFENMPMSFFNPMRDVWFPLDLSNAASFNAILAHAAAHLARMRGRKTSNEALKFKREAIRIVNQWINIPDRALSDDVFAAVLRLLTYERYWGTEAEWRVHRRGLEQMIEARGGFAALESNWRLGLALYLVSLMHKPSWFDSSNRIWELSGQPHLHPVLSSQENLDRVRCLWLISIVQDLRTFMNTCPQSNLHGLGAHGSIRDAMRLVEMDFEQDGTSSPNDSHMNNREYSRLACIFFICVLVQSSASVPDGSPGEESWSDMARMDAYLDLNWQLWQGGVEDLYTIIFQHDYEFPDKAQKADYVLNLTNVLGSRSLQARRGVERCLLHMLCPKSGSPAADADCDWSPDELLSTLRGM